MKLLAEQRGQRHRRSAMGGEVTPAFARTAAVARAALEELDRAPHAMRGREKLLGAGTVGNRCKSGRERVARSRVRVR